MMINMNKQEFLFGLRTGLSGLPEEEIEERLMFYSEIIDDRVEEGVTEEEAVKEIGNIDDLILQAFTDIPITKLVKERISPKKKLRIWEVVFLAIGSPLWLSFLLLLFVVFISVYLIIWVFVLVLWAAFVSVAVCGIAGMAAGTALAFNGNVLTGIAVASVSLFCIGLSILACFGCINATKCTLSLTCKLTIRIKRIFIRKEDVQ